MERINGFIAKVSEVFEPVVAIICILYVLICQILLLILMTSRAMILQAPFVFLEVFILYLVLIESYDATFEKMCKISSRRKCI
jgi:hypothetical protein